MSRGKKKAVVVADGPSTDPLASARRLCVFAKPPEPGKVKTRLFPAFVALAFAAVARVLDLASAIKAENEEII